MSELKCRCDGTGKLDPLMANLYDSVTERPFVNHNPGECRCTNEIKLYKRNGNLMYLCSCCNLSSDELVVQK